MATTDTEEERIQQAPLLSKESGSESTRCSLQQDSQINLDLIWVV